jgi:hypothetical protein
MSAFKNIACQKFGRAFVIAPIEPTPEGRWKWLCVCECGAVFRTMGKKLRSGQTQSCGCKRKGINRTHGKSGSPLYNTYHRVLQRCTNPLHPDYTDYGGRGIRCEWQSFAEFAQDMGEHPGGRYSIDRIDNDGPYSKQNCRWATPIQQANNSRQNHFLTYQGKRQTINQWARELGLKRETIKSRLQYGWSDEAALITPVRHY